MTGIPLLCLWLLRRTALLSMPCTVMVCFSTGKEITEPGHRGPELTKLRAPTNPPFLSTICLGRLTQQHKANTIFLRKDFNINFLYPLFYKSLTRQLLWGINLFNSERPNISQAHLDWKISASHSLRALSETLPQLKSLFHPRYYMVSLSNTVRYSPLQWFLMAQ